MNISNIFLRLGVLTLLCGIALGIWMGANENFTLRPVHAHVNLIGFVAMTLFGLFYRTFPDAGRSRFALAHFVLFLLAFAVMMPCLTVLLLGNPAIAPVLALSEITMLVSMLLFAVVVFRSTSGKAAAATA